MANGKRGGKRLNAGRKPTNVNRKQYGIRLTDKEYKIIATALYAERWKDKKINKLATDLMEAYLDSSKEQRQQILDREQPSIDYMQQHPEYVLPTSN